MGIQISCDYCDDNLTSTGGMPRFRLRLMSESVPHRGGSVFAVIVNPDITEDKYFCNRSHLLGWLEVAAVKSPKRVDAAIADANEEE